MKAESGPELPLGQGLDNAISDKEHEWERERLVSWLNISQTGLFCVFEIAKILVCINHKSFPIWMYKIY